MDIRKQAMILDGATDLYSLIRATLAISRGDDRLVHLDQVTEAFVEQVLAIEDRAAARPALRLVQDAG